MKPRFDPKLALAAAVFFFSLALLWSLLFYFNRLTTDRFIQSTSRWQIQIAQNLTNQITSALASGDDLAALIVLKTARKTYAQLHQAEVFDKQGTIKMHTDAGMMNKQTQPYAGPELSHPRYTRVWRDGRPFSTVLSAIPDSEGLYLRVVFDNAAIEQNKRATAVRLTILAILGSVLLSALTYWRVNRFEIVHPLQKADLPAAGAAEKTAATTRRIAELLLAEMRHAALAVDRNNTILAANALALELLNCRAEELEGLHVMQAPLPSALQEFYQQAIQTPEKTAEKRIALASKEPALPLKLVCTPPSSDWELALISLS